jgi:hypothetical protein
MQINLTPDQEVFVRQAVASGRCKNVEEAVQEAFFLWEARRRAEMFPSGDSFNRLETAIVAAAGVLAMGLMVLFRAN